jgi:hypothetical protein
MPKVKVKVEQLGVIGNKLHDRIQKGVGLVFPVP